MFTRDQIARFGSRGIRFVITGVTTTAVSYITFILVFRIAHYAVAGLASWLVSLGVSFVMNRRFTFEIRGPEKRGRDFVLFAVGAILQLLLALAGYRLLIGTIGLGPTPAFAINLVFTSAFSFLYLSLIAFRRRDTIVQTADRETA